MIPSGGAHSAWKPILQIMSQNWAEMHWNIVWEVERDMWPFFMLNIIFRAGFSTRSTWKVKQQSSKSHIWDLCVFIQMYFQITKKTRKLSFCWHTFTTRSGWSLKARSENSLGPGSTCCLLLCPFVHEWSCNSSSEKKFFWTWQSNASTFTTVSNWFSLDLLFITMHARPWERISSMETPSLFQRDRRLNSLLPKCRIKLLKIMISLKELNNKSISHFSASCTDSMEEPCRMIRGSLLLGEKSLLWTADGRSRKNKTHFCKRP